MQINDASWEQLKKDVGLEVFPLIIDSFVQEIETHTINLTQAISGQDIQQIGSLAHSLKSSARTLGLDAIADCAQTTETLAQSSDDKSVITEAKGLLALIDGAVEAINNKRNQE